MKIRKAKLKDFQEYLKLFKLFRKDDEKVFLSGFFLEIVALNKGYKHELEKNFRKYVYSPKKILFFAEDNGKIIGMSYASILDYGASFKYNIEGHIDGLFVKKEYRRKGVSSLLKNKLLDWFKSKNLKFVGLETMEKNKHAQKIYQKWGFKFFSRKMKLKLK